MRLDLCDWIPDDVAGDFENRDDREQLDHARLARLAGSALFVAGRGETELHPLLAAYYPEYAKRVPADERARIFARIRNQVREGVLACDVLVHFLRGDPERCIAAETAFELAWLDVTEAGGGAHGADYVLRLVVERAVANPGAALGGLLALANRGVNAKLAVLRPALALPDADAALEQMAKCARGYVHAATVEFWLEWMEALVASLPGSQRVLDRAADALVCQREEMVERIVVDGYRIVPAPRRGDLHDAGTRKIPLGEYAASIAPRLAAIAGAAPESENVRRALAAWGLLH
jgi:hypothetical protein